MTRIQLTCHERQRLERIRADSRVGVRVRSRANGLLMMHCPNADMFDLLSQTDIADLAHITPATLRRLARVWRERGCFRALFGEVNPIHSSDELMTACASYFTKLDHGKSPRVLARHLWAYLVHHDKIGPWGVVQLMPLHFLLQWLEQWSFYMNVPLGGECRPGLYGRTSPLSLSSGVGLTPADIEAIHQLHCFARVEP